MKCGPDGCPIVAFSDLTPAEQRVQRKRYVAKMAEQGFTEQHIAKQLGVGQATVSRDLGNLSIVDKLKPAKTASNPKGAGRPKGKANKERRKNETPEAQAAARDVVDGKKTYSDAERETGFSNVVMRSAVAREEGRRAAEPIITPDMLSMTAQQKNEAWRRQEKSRMTASFDAAVTEGVRNWVDDVILPDWKKKIEQAKELYARRTGLMTEATFKTIFRALHPDSRLSISDKLLNEAFIEFRKLEKYLLDEKASPTDFGRGLPRSWAEWEEAKRKATADRKAKYAASRGKSGNSVRPR